MGNINSPTKAIHTQLASTAISQQPTSQTAQNNLFGNTGGGGGNLFNTRPARPPATEEEKTTLKTSLSLYPIQPETPEGEAAYLDQLRTWQRTNGDNNVTKSQASHCDQEEPHQAQENATTADERATGVSTARLPAPKRSPNSRRHSEPSADLSWANQDAVLPK